MKRFLLFAFATLLVASSLAGDSTAPKSHDVGRFRLLRATATTVTDKSHLEQSLVFKIDSVSGDTWIYRSVLTGATYREGWVPLNSFHSAQEKLDTRPIPDNP